MKRLLVPLLLLAAACPKSAAYPVEVKLDGALYAEKCGEVTAEWLGTPPEAGTPRSFGTEALRFRFTDTVLPFEPPGQLSFSDWSYEVFSPDCQHVLLLQDSAGPYHLVALSQLRQYLKGGSPLAVIQRPAAADAPAAIHNSQRWISATDFEFFASCCGGTDVYRGTVTAPTELQRVFSAASAPKGLRRTTEGGYEAVP